MQAPRTISSRTVSSSAASSAVVVDDASGDEVPFATPTLARLYLEQGHHEAARRIAARLRNADTPALQPLDQTLDTESHRRQRVLESLLAKVRANKREAADEPVKSP